MSVRFGDLLRRASRDLSTLRGRASRAPQALRLLAAALLASGLLSAAPAAAELPASKLLTGTLVTPTAAWSAYASGAGGHTLGATAWSAPPPEITALARSLGADRINAGSAPMSQAQYIQNVSDYIRKNIETEFHFGLTKGGRGALIDQSGTAFDQADLMVQLLAVPTITGTVQPGTITLNATQFGQWSGLVTGLAGQSFTVEAAAACRLLADGGIPALVNGASTCAGLSGNLSTVTLMHVWVSAGGNLYDPAFKPHIFKPRIDLATALQCGTDAAPSCGSTLATDALISASTTPISGFAAIRSANETATEGQAGLYAQHLQSWIQTNNPLAELDDILGGGRIDLTYSPTPGSSLPYSASALGAGWAGINSIPDQFRATLRLQFGDVDRTFFADEVATRRLRILVTNPGSGLVSTLYADRIALQNCSTCLSSPPSVTVTAHHPYAGAAGFSGQFATDSISVPIGDIGGGQNLDSYIVQGWGDAGPSTQKFFGDLQAVDPDPLRTNGASFSGDDQVTLGASLLVQRSLANRVVGAVGRAPVGTHHTIGVITGVIDTGAGLNLNYQFSVAHGVSVAPTSAAVGDGSSAYETVALVQSMLEGSVTQQMRNIPHAVSGPHVFVEQNRQGVAFIDVLASQTASAAATLGYNGWFSSANAENYEVISTAIEGVNPSWIPTGITSGQGAWLFDMAFKPGRTAYLLNKSYKGGATGAPTGVDPVALALKATKDQERPRKTSEASFDLATGALNVQPAPDLVSGSGGFPESLPFQRYYSSTAGTFEALGESGGAPSWTYVGADADSGSRLPGGWSHNYAITARLAANPQKAFGRDSALDASAAIASAYALNDLLAAPTFQKRIASLFVADYLGGQLTENAMTVTLPPTAETFFLLPDGVTYHAPPGSASKLELTHAKSPTILVLPQPNGGETWDYGPATYSYTGRDGAVIKFDNGSQFKVAAGVYAGEPMFKATDWTFPSGMNIHFTYATDQAVWSTPSLPGPGYLRYPLSSVNNSFGRWLFFTSIKTGGCQLVAGGGGPHGGGNHCEFYFNTGQLITAVTDESNRMVQFSATGCPTLQQPNFTVPLFTDRAFACNSVTVTNALAPTPSVQKYEYAADAVSPDPAVIDRPNFLLRRLYSASNTAAPMLSFKYDDALRLSGQLDGLGRLTTAYAGGLFDGERFTRGQSIDPTGASSLGTYDYRNHRTLAIDPNQHVTAYAYDGMGRSILTTKPESDAIAVTYDLRSNPLTSCHIQKSRVGQACSTAAGDLLTQTSYGEGSGVVTCAAPATCNKPFSITDPKGLVRGYQWNAYGQLIQILGPSDANGVQPKTTFAYTPTTAASQTVQMLTAKTDWITATDTTVTTYAYAPTNRFVLASAVVDQGAGNLNLTTAFTFDGVGNIVAVDGPRPGAGDTTQYAWDADRRLVMAVQPAAANGFRTATKTVYDPDGLVTDVYQGVATSADPATFGTIKAHTANAYDVVGNRTSLTIFDGATTTPLQLTQFSYDGADRSRCTVVRMTALSAPPADPCVAAGQGATADRLTFDSYFPGGQLQKVAKAVGTSAEINFAQYTYSANDQKLTLTDGLATAGSAGNVTAYQYDDFDRLTVIQYPMAARAAGAPDPTNFEQFSYDKNDNRLTYRRRSNQTINYQYDNLNRVILKSGAVPQAVAYSYDLLGRKTQALYSGTNGKAISHTYDHVGRKTVENAYDWQLQYIYDEAGNVIQAKWPDGVYTTYAYDNANRLSTVTQSTGTQLASLTYDEIGRRVGLARPNLINTTYGYDGASRLSSLTHAMTASGQPGDSEGMSYNPAGQVLSLTHAAPFVWQNQPTVAQNDTHDGLNRLSRLISASPSGYNLNGDLTNDGTFLYSYDVEGHMTGASGPVTTIEAYDPEGRIRSRNTSIAGISYLQLDGEGHISAEYAANGLISSGGNPATPPIRRYVFIPGEDQPLVWYEGSTPYWLIPDREGSIIAWANSSGVVSSSPGGTVNYSPYGEPSTWNMPKYGYTGQMVFGELQLYYYKARLYSPALGRFLQTDPLGYDAGDTNLYAYVGDDPTDHEDPTGTEAACAGSGGNCGVSQNLKQDIKDHPVAHALGAAAFLGPLALGAAPAAVPAIVANAPAITQGVAAVGEAVAPGSGSAALAGAAGAAHEVAAGRSVGVGEHAGESIAARSSARDFTPAERAQVNRIGSESGCHSCGTTNPGTKSGNFVPDHQPPSSVNPPGGAQRLLPQCLSCSRQQGLDLARLVRALRGQ